MEPHLQVEVESVAPAAPGLWQMTWRVQADQALAIESAWVPHGRFRGQGRLDLAPPLPLPASVAMTVHASEAPGTLVENAFLILRLTQGWRVFVRMRVEFDAAGVPRPVPELVTVQSTGAAE